jgi:hypothetical protein
LADQNLANPGSIEQTLLGKIPKHTFTIPDQIFENDKDGKPVLVSRSPRELETDPKTITLRQLTYADELQALAAAESRRTSYQYEGAMRSVVSADGRDITWTNNEKETFFSGLSQAVRELVLRGFSAIALPTVRATADFLASEKVTLG